MRLANGILVELDVTGESARLRIEWPAQGPGLGAALIGVEADELAQLGEECMQAAFAMRSARALRGDGARFGSPES